MPTQLLPHEPSLEHLRKQAKRLLKASRAGDAEALAQVKEFHPRADARARLSLSGSQLVIARSYGFTSWATLKQHLIAIEPYVWNPPPPPQNLDARTEVFLKLACLSYGGWHRSNPDRAERLLAEHPDVARADVYCAAASGNVEAVREALEREPARLNAKGGLFRWEPLLYACYSRMPDADPGRSTLEVARWLLAQGADPNAGFLWGANYLFTALTGAFGEGEDNMNQLPHPRSLELATLLLEAGADANDGQTLYNRHFNANDDHLTLLFAYGLGTTPGRERRGPWPSRLGERAGTPAEMLVQDLCWAAKHGRPERVRLLIEHGVDVNTPGPRDHRTPYEEALRAGHTGVAEYLLRHGAKKIELDPVETFALACIAGRREEVRARLAKDPALLDKLGAYGRVELLHRALDAGQRDGVRLIAELGVDINGMMPGTGLDRTVLHNAAGWKGLDWVKFLLDLGADPHLRDPTFHGAAIGWALYAQQHEVVEYLVRSASIVDAVRAGGVDRVAELFRENPALATTPDEDGDPLTFYLHPGIARLEEMIALFAQHGLTLDAPNSKGETALDRAVARGAADFADLLGAQARRAGPKPALSRSPTTHDGPRNTGAAGPDSC